MKKQVLTDHFLAFIGCFLPYIIADNYSIFISIGVFLSFSAGYFTAKYN